MKPQIGTEAVRLVVLDGAAVLFATPLIASALFGFSSASEPLTAEPLLDAVANDEFWPDVIASLLLAACTTFAVLLLLVPTLCWLHLRMPRLLILTEVLSVLPLVVPAVALVNGVNLVFRNSMPGFLASMYSLVPFYTVLVMPLVYRTLDAGFRSIDLRTLVDASKSLGAGSLRTFFGIVLPNLRQALVSAALLTSALVLGEFTLATLLLHSTYPVFLAQIGQDSPRAAAALAVMTLGGTWLLLALFTGLAGRGRRARRAKRQTDTPNRTHSSATLRATTAPPSANLDPAAPHSAVPSLERTNS